MSQQDLTIIGRVEPIAFIDYGIVDIPAKIDTGADTSSVWATEVAEGIDGLSFVLFAPESEYYTGQVITLPKSKYTITRVSNSFGDREFRYKVKLRVQVQGHTVRATFTLANRQDKLYPALIGRRLLKGRFLVDVKQGHPLTEAEKKRRERLNTIIEALPQGKAELS